MYAVRRIVPRKDKNGNPVEPLHIGCNAVHRLKAVYKDLEQEKASQCPGSPWLELPSGEDLQSPRLPAPSTWQEGFSDSGQRQAVDLVEVDETQAELTLDQDFADTLVDETQPVLVDDTVASTQPAQLEPAEIDSGTDTPATDLGISARMDDELFPPGQDFDPSPDFDLEDQPAAGAEDAIACIDIPSSQDTGGKDEPGAPFGDAMALVSGAMAIPAGSSHPKRKMQKKPAAKAAKGKMQKKPAGCLKRPAAADTAEAAQAPTSPPQSSAPLITETITTPPAKRAKSKLTPEKQLAARAGIEAETESETQQKVSVAMKGLCKLQLEGWCVESRVRQGGATAGTVDVYFKSPEQKLFRSLAAVARWKAEQEKTAQNTDTASTQKAAAAPADGADWFPGDRSRATVRFSTNPAPRHSLMCNSKQVIQVTIKAPMERAAHGVYMEQLKSAFMRGAS